MQVLNNTASWFCPRWILVIWFDEADVLQWRAELLFIAQEFPIGFLFEWKYDVKLKYSIKWLLGKMVKTSFGKNDTKDIYS